MDVKQVDMLRCPRCDTVIGTRTESAIVSGHVTAWGKAAIRCERCGKRSVHTPKATNMVESRS